MFRHWITLAVIGWALAGIGLADAQPAGKSPLTSPNTSSTPNPTRRAAPPAASSAGPAWSELTPAQQSTLRPLANEWHGIDATRKRKWIEIADRFPKMSREDQVRMQTRMTEWARLTPEQRRTARMNFQGAKQLSPEERQAKWRAYQELSEEQKRQLAAGAGKPGAAARGPTAPGAAAPPAAAKRKPSARARGAPRPPNIAPAPGLVDSTTLLPVTPPGQAPGTERQPRQP